jgi:hypothetical protein
MSPHFPRRPRRLRPGLVVNAALATTLLAVAAAGDSVPLPVPGAADDSAGERTDLAAPPGVVDEQASGLSPDSAGGVPAGDALLADAVAPLLAAAGPDARLSVSVVALDTGATAAYGRGAFDTASIVKVDILAALLLQAQDEGRTLTAEERRQAEEMIRSSDNDAADALWRTIGGEAGLDAANRRLGLTGTTGGEDGHWGLTQTTSEDQAALLRAIYTPASPLSATARGYIRRLMGEVVPEQRWGVSAAADGRAGDATDPDSDPQCELKNGWLPRTASGLWDVNSIGRVVSGGREYLVAVVSAGHVTREDGIALVEGAARAAVATAAAVTAGADAMAGPAI